MCKEYKSPMINVSFYVDKECSKNFINTFKTNHDLVMLSSN